MKLQPLNDHVIVRRDAKLGRSEGGIVLPDAAQEAQSRGVVIAVGPGARDEKGERLPMNVAVGQTVLFARYAGDEIEVDNQKLCFMRESGILAVLS